MNELRDALSIVNGSPYYKMKMWLGKLYLERGKFNRYLKVISKNRLSKKIEL
jgi:hypothetical protein